MAKSGTISGMSPGAKTPGGGGGGGGGLHALLGHLNASPSYLPAGPSMAPSGSQQGPIARRALHSQVLGSVVGRRGAGITNLSGGDGFAHSMNHYGKAGLGGLADGEEGGGY